ncbi:GTPase Era [Parvibium lacunae]|uniref:GTPase Era n=1 Tax=Parvibium lacunae TaxID=1888893 RepID=A0A368L8I8_9BURK|nr:GTPase Era [Parvibium lacunae]RCS59549.1 GTPase Era [Parvibium lacunae]
MSNSLPADVTVSNEMPAHGPRRVGYVAIVGRPNVGKSTLLNAMIGAKVSITSRKAQTTRHRIHGVLTTASAQFVFVDTPGFQTKYGGTLNRVMNRVVTQTLSDIDVVLLVCEAGRVTPADREVLKLLPQQIPVLLVLNKVDLVEPKEKLLPLLAEMQQLYPFAAIIPVSAHKGLQLDHLQNEIAMHLPWGELLFAEDDLTDRNERFIAAEFVREKLFRLLGEELPYGCTVVVEKYELEGQLRRIYCAILIDKDAHKPIILGRQGERIKRIGMEARQDLERLFSGSVYLEIFVKTRSGWADSEASLRQLGYE